MAERMVALAGEQPGFLGVESVREGVGITASYWSDWSRFAIGKPRQNIARHSEPEEVAGIKLTRYGLPKWNVTTT